MKRDLWSFPSLHYRNVMEVVFTDERTPIFKLAMKVIEGAEFTPEDLQLQQNEPEALEKMLREIREFMEK